MKLVSDNPDNVIPIFRRSQDDPEKKRRFCPHGGTMLIDEDTRLVQCGLCETWLDAFTALRVLTREWDRHVNCTKWAKCKYEEIRDKVADLKREEANTKARLRNAKKKLASVTRGQEPK